MSGRPAGEVLVLGVVLVDRENVAAQAHEELRRTARWRVEQRWVALGKAPPPAALAAAITARSESPAPKFTLVNRLLAAADLERYDFVVVCDDDVRLPPGFLERYLDVVVKHDLALAQPARTHGSYIDHAFVEQLDGLEARWTRFVEIGPVFSLRRDAVSLLTPFDEESPMGWGYDFVWPVVIEGAGLRMGIVDATPVAHDLRPPVVNYDHAKAERAMRTFLSKRAHLSRFDAFTILEAYS